MAGEVRVRTLTREDIPWAIALTDTESWGYTIADFERLLALEPDGVFVAESRAERIGMTATVTYGPLAYVGAVIVDAAWRRKGVGETVMQAALAFAEARGVESVRLNAYTHVIPFYERLGFRQEFENRRYAGRSEGWGVPGVRLAREDDLEGMARLDREYFGADRSRLLRRLLHEFPKSSLVLDDGGDIVTYAFGNTSGESCEIGPFVCAPERAAQAEALLNAMLGLVDAPCAFSLPAVNAKGVAAAERGGLRQAFRTVRMVRGSPAHGGRPDGIFALAGLEKG
ncbi:MAG: GNAT family N-acetyltransferase [Euryarchaeota archaeon]|nr:GNAT family N-acetyltransferase [Euryarchaeota archaeon]